MSDRLETAMEPIPFRLLHPADPSSVVDGGDLARCHDPVCGQRRQCRRWRERSSGGVSAAQAPSLYQFNPLDASEPCSAFLPAVDG